MNDFLVAFHTYILLVFWIEVLTSPSLVMKTKVSYISGRQPLI